MTKALLRVRFRALFHSMLRQSRQKRRHGTGMTVLFILLFAYVGVVFCGMFALMFSKLAPAYHTAGLDWLYFATAGLMALGLSVFGSVFATQSQIYDAKDNGLLLSMPIPPRTILLSRVLPLMVLNGVFSLLVLGPAGVVYGTMVGYTPVGLVAFVLCCLAVIAVTSYVSLGSCPRPCAACWAGCSTCSSAGSTSPWPLPFTWSSSWGFTFISTARPGIF